MRKGEYMQKFDMLKQIFLVMFFKSDNKLVGYQETQHVLRIVKKKACPDLICSSFRN